jgi:hypothetical protein
MCYLRRIPKQLKKYVVPAWACTNTTTQPRLSEEVLAQRAAAAAQVEAEAEKEKTKKRGRGGKSENENKDNKEPEGTKKKQQRPLVGMMCIQTC